MKYGWENIYDLVRSKQLIVIAAAASSFNFLLNSLCSIFVMMLSCGKPFECERLAISLIIGPYP